MHQLQANHHTSDADCSTVVNLTHCRPSYFASNFIKIRGWCAGNQGTLGSVAVECVGRAALRSSCRQQHGCCEHGHRCSCERCCDSRACRSHETRVVSSSWIVKTKYIVVSLGQMDSDLLTILTRECSQFLAVPYTGHVTKVQPLFPTRQERVHSLVVAVTNVSAS